MLAYAVRRRASHARAGWVVAPSLAPVVLESDRRSAHPTRRNSMFVGPCVVNLGAFEAAVGEPYAIQTSLLCVPTSAMRHSSQDVAISLARPSQGAPMHCCLDLSALGSGPHSCCSAVTAPILLPPASTMPPSKLTADQRAQKHVLQAMTIRVAGKAKDIKKWLGKHPDLVNEVHNHFRQIKGQPISSDFDA